jgi:hypothetical protein
LAVKERYGILRDRSAPAGAAGREYLRISKLVHTLGRLPPRFVRAAWAGCEILYWALTLQLRAGLRLRREARLVRRSGLFDARFYLAQCAGDPAAAKDPVRHFILHGAARGLEPGPLFHSADYVARNPSAAPPENALLHFIRAGGGGERPPLPRTQPRRGGAPGRGVAGPRGKVLVIGVYLADKKNLATPIVRELGRSREWEVAQRWIALGESPVPEPLAPVTTWRQHSRLEKFPLLNRALREVDLAGYRYVLVCDDDISLPEGFLDRYLELVEGHDLALAQPARTHGSYIDHWIVEQHDGLAVRATRYVEIGPLFSMRADAARLLVPFDEGSPMGWGLDFVWPVVLERAGLRLGIVDETPVVHDLRRPAAYYDDGEAVHAMNVYLASRPHLTRQEAFRVVEAYA